MDHVCHNKQGSKRKSRQMEADGKRKVRRKMQEPTSGTSTDGGLQSLTTGIAARAVTASQQTSMSAEQRERIGFVTSPGVRGRYVLKEGFLLPARILWRLACLRCKVSRTASLRQQ